MAESSDEGPMCPYCKRQYTADEQCYWVMSEMECDDCGKTFSVEADVSTTWFTREKA